MTSHVLPELLTDYVHGELPPDADASVHAHLLTCAACRTELERETALTDRLRNAALAQTYELPESVKAAVRRAIAVKEAPFSRIPGLLRLAALPFAAALLIGVFLLNPLLHTPSQHPSIDAAFYLNAHAAQQARNPLTEHNAAPYNQTAYDESANNVVR